MLAYSGERTEKVSHHRRTCAPAAWLPAFADQPLNCSSPAGDSLSLSLGGVLTNICCCLETCILLMTDSILFQVGCCRVGREEGGRAHVASRMDGATTGLDIQGPTLTNRPPAPIVWSPAPTAWPIWTPETPPEDEEDENFPWSATPSQFQLKEAPRDSDLFELLNRLQGARLDDQRVTMGSNSVPWMHSRHRLESLLRGSPPYPIRIHGTFNQSSPHPKCRFSIGGQASCHQF